MYVSSVKISRLRCFESQEVSFQYPTKPSDRTDHRIDNVTLLLGDNGAGKTTTLKAVCLAVLGPVIQDSGYKPDYLIRRIGEEHSSQAAEVSASVTLHGQDVRVPHEFGREIAQADAHASITARGDYERLTAMYGQEAGSVDDDVRSSEIDSLFDDTSPAYFIVGYGATRRVASPSSTDLQQDKRRGLRYQRVAGLFEDYVSLWPLKLWLPELKESSAKRFQEVVELIGGLLPDDTRFDGRFEELQPVFTHRGIDLPFTALSDGYRGYIGVLGDLLYHLHRGCPRENKLVDLAGIVLVDDIDLHLHPKWQRTVVSKLANGFPRLQFIVTSHSPLVAGGLYAENIRIIESPPKGPSNVICTDERIHGLNVDQVLTSAYFGLESTRSPDQARKLAEMARDVSRTRSPSASVAFLQELAGKKPE